MNPFNFKDLAGQIAVPVRHLQYILEQIELYIPGETVWAFGSRVKRSHRPASDLDLAVLCDKETAKKMLAKLNEVFVESDLPFKVQLLDFNRLPANMRENIKKEYVILYQPQEKKTDVSEIYYRRVISKDIGALLMHGGGLNWLFMLVKQKDDLDFLIGANSSEEWISVYRGTTRFLKISLKYDLVSISAHPKYIELAKQNNLRIYGHKKHEELNFKDDFIKLINLVGPNRHYDNKKEGYFQNLFSRQFGILSEGGEEFVVIDKEAVVGYKNIKMKEKYFGEQRKRYIDIRRYLSESNPKKYGSKLPGDCLGNEVDFLAVAKSGDVLLIEFKHGSNAKGIYLSPIQLGFYYDLFQEYISRYKDDFIRNINDMLEQRREIGLIACDWSGINTRCKLIPVLIIAEFNEDSSAFNTFKDVLNICRDKLKDESFLSKLKIYNYNENRTLEPLIY